MKKLSTELRAQRAAYRGVRYPGDLVAEVMLTRTRARRRWPWVGLAAAAMIAAALYLRLPAHNSPASRQVSIAPSTQAQPRQAAHDDAAPANSSDTQAEVEILRFTPSACTFDLAPPTMSFVSETSEITTIKATEATKKEPV